MNVAILTLGTLGDVQPYVALGAGLKAAGHEVTLVTGRGFEAMVSGRGLRYVPLNVDLLPARVRAVEGGQGRAPVPERRLARGARADARNAQGLDGRVGGGGFAGRGRHRYHPKAMGGYHVAEALGVPGFLALPVPALSPTGAFPVPVLPLPNLGAALNRLSYGTFFRSLTLPYRPMVNQWRERTLGLTALPLRASELELRGEPIVRLYPCSPTVVPVPADWDGSSAMTGNWFLDQGKDWRPPDELAAFLRDGPPPVYVGFGTAAPDPEGSRASAFAALRRLGLRGVLATGRHGMADPEIIEIEGAPHDWLFPRMAAVAHHGGAGTTAEGLRAGRPTAVFPSNFGDQLFWGRRVRALGMGPEPVPQKRLTIERLTAAIRAVTEDEGARRRAEELGERVRGEDGVARAVELIERAFAER